MIDVDNVCKKFTDWLEVARPGEKYCYHIGTHISGNRIARIAFQAYEAHRVILYQRREPKNFSYWAQKV